jgi:hypothetical protein
MILPQQEGASVDCLNEQTIARFATPDSPALDAAHVAHLAECARCRVQLAGAIEALRHEPISAEIQRLDQRGSQSAARPMWKHARLTAAAAAIAALVIVPQLVRDSGDDRRSGPRALRDNDATITMTVAPVIVAPRGAVASITRLTWTRVPGADQYVVTIFSADGSMLWQTETTDTTAMLPAAFRSEENQLYLWQVRARTGVDRWVESDLVEFTVSRGLQEKAGQ